MYLAGGASSATGIASGGHQNALGAVSGFNAFLAKFEGGMVGIATLSPSDHRLSIPIWPNPNTGDRLYLQIQDAGTAEVELFDALGKLQLKEPIKLLY